MASDLIAGVEAFGTLAVAIAAIWGDWIRAKLLPPRLRLELSDPEGQRIPQVIEYVAPPGFQIINPPQESHVARYYHLIVSNDKPFAVAHEVQIVMTRLEGVGPGGQPQEIYRVPLPLSWRNQRELDPRPWRTLGGRSHEADLLFVREDGLLQFTPMAFPRDFPGLYKESVVLWVTLEAWSIEGASRPLRLKVAWDGKWERGDAEMKRHLQIIPESFN
jgi:hypothetical protein